MSINLEINTKQLCEKLELHYLPAGIEGDGEAKVDDYFNNYTVAENNRLTNALRGFPIDGTEFAMPTETLGLVIQETKPNLNESANRLFRVTGTFDKITYWNYDKLPSPADALRQAMQVISVANELSNAVSVEDLQNEMLRDTKVFSCSNKE